MNFWLLFGLCMLVSAIGFKNYVWFISLGYGFSIAAQGVALLILHNQQLTLGTIITCVLFILYGLRLGGYLAIREFGKSSYKKNMVGEIKDGKTVPFGVKIAIWTSCAVLYVTQISGVFYRLLNAAQDNIFVFIGAAVMLAGVSLETAADIQKNGDTVLVKRMLEDGYMTIKVQTPCLLTCIKELNEPRYMSVYGIFDCYSKPYEVLDYNALKDDPLIDPSTIGLMGSPTNILTSFTPPQKGAGMMLEGADKATCDQLAGMLAAKHMI